MNKIYKVIWSKARHQYVVASELAKSVTKGAGSRIGRTAAAVLVAIVLTAGAGLPAQAASEDLDVKGDIAGVDWFAHAVLTTGSVQNVLNGQNLALGGLTVNGYNVLTEAAMDGYVKWDADTTDTIKGVQFGGNGNLTGANITATGALSASDSAANKIGGVTLQNGVVSNLTAGTNDMDAVNVKQMKDADTATLNSAKNYTDGQMDGVVKWDDENDNSIHGVRFDGNGALSVAEDRFSVDKYGNIAAQTYGGEGDDTHYYFDMSHADGIQMGYSNGSSMNIDPFGVHFKVGEQETTINGNTIVTGRVNADTVQADNMYVGTQTPGHAVVTQDQLTDGIDTATEGVVKWDTDAEGNYVDGSLRGMHFLGKDGIVTFGNENKVLINGTTGQIVADSMGANSIATKNLSAGNGAVTVDENGKLSTTGDVSMINSTGELVSLTDDRGLTMMTSGDHGTGMLTMDDGSISMMGGTNTIVTMDENGTTFGTLMGDEKTVISGNSITTGSVTGLTNTEWTGKAEDIVENRAATEGQLAALSDDLNASIGTATEGVVKWDEDGNGGYKEGYLTAEHQLSAGNGNLLVDEEGVHLKTPGEILGDAKDETNYYLDMTNEHGISMGYTGGTSMTITTQGVTFSAAGGNATHINGNSIATTDANGAPGGQISTGTVYASENMYIGDSQNPDNEVATKGDLNAAVGEATQNVVKYDDNGELHAGTENTGKLDLDKENGAASLTSGNGEHSLSVTNDGTSVTGGMAVEGGMLVSGGLTVDGSVQIANEDGSFSSLATSEDVSKVQEEVDQNTADIGKLNNKVGTGDITATDKDGNAYGNLTDAVNGNNSMIHENTSSISTIKDQIGGTGENGALNLANGQTTIEGGINYNYAAIQQQGQAINALGGRVHELGEEIDSVGAISSALAGLHPLDYDGTGSKFQLSAAMGTYDGTQAAAIGGFYHFNEDVMLSLGGATAFNGEHKTAANIGVTFRVGPGGSEKKPATPDEVMATLDAMNRKIQEMDAKIAALEQDKKDLTEENQQLKAEAAEAVTAEAPAAEEQA